MPNPALIAEWSTLQTQYDRLEQQSLLIKLVAITLTVAILILQASQAALVAIALIFWLQDAIWKTFQSRCEARLMAIENAIATPDASSGFIALQFNREFHHRRPGTVGLIAEYLSHACRPTVAFPHALLTLILILHCGISQGPLLFGP